MPDEHPVSHALAMATAEALADAAPPVRLSGPRVDPLLRRLESVLPADVRVAFLRGRAGDWEARPYDPDEDRAFGEDSVGRGATLGGAIAELCAQLTDSVARVAHELVAA